jgi:pyruvate,water dikinase
VPPLILPFTAPEPTLARAGGKGLNLSALARAGFPVPPGFIVTTDAYRAFVAANQIQDRLLSLVKSLAPDDPIALESASTQIAALFAEGHIPPDIAEAITSAYNDLSVGAGLAPALVPAPAQGRPQGSPLPVAVRSSATAEDLPGLSFAGQQETYLNIVGADAVLNAVKKCWASLWTARAIGYRARNNIAPEEVILAVVVQSMIASDSSGVLFTANPLTGHRGEMVIDASFGLGEAIVQGLVEPDHNVIDSTRWTITARKLGTKAITIVPRAEGGVGEEVKREAAAQQALPDPQIIALAQLAGRVADHFESPQDIEWAWANDQLYLLQSRPITSLFPVPKVSFDPLIIWFSFGAVQGLVGPITPLGRDAIHRVAAGAGAMFGLRLKPEEVDLFAPAGERIWIKISDFIRHPIGNRLFGELLSFVEPSVGRILKLLAADPRLGAGTGKLKLSTLRRLARFALPVLARLARNTLHPDDARYPFEAAITERLSTARIPPADDRFGRLANVITFMQDRIASVFSFLLPQFIPVFGPSMAALNLLNRLGNRTLALEATRGLPNNVTTEMDLALWRTATEIRADRKSADFFGEADAPALARHYLNGALPSAAQTAIARFMDQYGMRGVGEIDIGQPRWREDPTPVMHTLQSYLSIAPEFAPDVVFARGERAAQAAIEKLAAEARGQPGGWLKEKLVRAAARRIRLLMGARESPKFFAIRTMGIARRALLEVGQEFVEAGAIDRPDDLVFLQLSELESLSRNETRDWKALIAERRAAYERELRRPQAPRVLVSDGRAFYEGLGAETEGDDTIIGSPVSPGVAEGFVRVVLDPRHTQLAPGEILVCPGTDPAWTPLFMAAGGLVTEVGGMMTHGSVVAREYGIPAVVGVESATVRLKTGQRVRVDGTTGRVMVLT